MKKIRSFIALFAVSFIFQTCSFDKNIDGEDKSTIIVNGMEVGGVGHVKITPTGTDEYDVLANFFVIDAGGSIISNLSTSNLSIEQPSYKNVTYSFSSLIETSLGSTSSYDATLLLDQSGSILYTDPLDLRIEGSKYFGKQLANGDRMYLGSFSTGLTWYRDNFTSNASDYDAVLDKLKNTEGGDTRLYHSTYDAITKTKELSSKSNKAVIVFTDGEDNIGGKSPSDIINYSQSNGVKVYTVGLKNAKDYELSMLANGCNGFYVNTYDPKQLLSLYNSLGKIINQSNKVFQVKIHIKKQGYVKVINQKLKITLQNGKIISMPFNIELP